MFPTEKHSEIFLNAKWVDSLRLSGSVLKTAGGMRFAPRRGGGLCDLGSKMFFPFFSMFKSPKSAENRGEGNQCDLKPIFNTGGGVQGSTTFNPFDEFPAFDVGIGEHRVTVCRLLFVDNGSGSGGGGSIRPRPVWELRIIVSDNC